MDANMEWNSVLLSLADSSVVVSFFSFVDRMFFRFWSKWINSVASDLGRYFLMFYYITMGQVSRLPTLMA